MNVFKHVAVGALIALPTLAAAEDFEVIGIYESNSIGGTYAGVSLRGTLMQGDPAAAETAQTGLRVRVDSSVSAFATNYDATDGTGTNETQRLILTYGLPISANSTVTLGVGATYHYDIVRPITASSPADSSANGTFLFAELESTFANGSRFHALIEDDSAGATYGSVSYQMAFGSMRVGPMANLVKDDDYSRTAYGLSAAFEINENFEIGINGALADEQIGLAVPSHYSYFGLFLRAAF